VTWIFDGAADDQGKLHAAKQAFLDALSATNDFRLECERAYAFRAGDQWDPAAKQQLRNEGRPALTFNIVGSQIRQLVGAANDQRREAKVRPVGPEDLPTSGVINHLRERVYAEGEFERCEDAAFDNAVTGGIGHVFLDAHPDPEYPDRLCITLEHISPFEVVVDPSASKPNAEDAKYVFWHRWYSESEFKAAFPENAGDWEKIQGEWQSGVGGTGHVDPDVAPFLTERAKATLRDPRFFQGRGSEKNRIRIIHCEYEAAAKKYLAWDPRINENGEEVGWQEVERATYEALKKGDVTPTRAYNASEWRWFVFTGLQVLFDDKQPLPIKGPQIKSLTCFQDELAGFPYGIVRDLMDPQREVNKRTSEETNWVSQSTKLNLIVDRGSLGSDLKEAERKARKSGGILEKTPGAEVQIVQPPQIPPTLGTLSERSLRLVQLISGINIDPLLGEHAQNAPVGTALLRHRQSLQQISGVIENFYSFQRSIVDAVVRVLLLSVSDEQIAEMLGNAERYVLQGTRIVDRESGKSVDIDSLRAIRWNIEHETAAANTTQQIIGMQVIVETGQAIGMPIDPDVVIEMMPVSGEDKQKLRLYAKQAQAQAAQAQQQEAAINAQQVSQVFAIEQGKTEQRREEATTDALIKLLEIVLKSGQVQGEQEIADLQQAKAFLDTIVSSRKQQSDARMRGGSKTAPLSLADVRQAVA
jgi:hypothetical protein